MRLYQEMMFGMARADAALRQSYRTLLLQYCELDTKAMVFIWMHWLSGQQTRQKKKPGTLFGARFTLNA